MTLDKNTYKITEERDSESNTEDNKNEIVSNNDVHAK